MRKLMFIAFMAMSVCGYAQKYGVGTATTMWEAPAATGFLHAKAIDVKYIEVAFDQCYRGVPAGEVIPRIKEVRARIDSMDIEVWSIHLLFSQALDISVLDDRLRKENVDFMVEMIELCAMLQPICLVLHPSSGPIADSVRAQRIASASESVTYLKKYAGRISAQFCIENLPRTCLGNTLEEPTRIVGDISDVKVCFDTSRYAKGTTEHFVAIVGNRIDTIHASDFGLMNERHWLPTQGDIKWGELMQDLEKTGYKGVFMYETTKDHENNNVRPTLGRITETFDKITDDYKTLKQYE